jgi:hypothetical protein
MIERDYEWLRKIEKCLRMIENDDEWLWNVYDSLKMTTNDCEWINHVFKKKIRENLKELILIFVHFVIYDRKMIIKHVCDIHVNFTMIKIFTIVKRLYCEFEKLHLNYDSKMSWKWSSQMTLQKSSSIIRTLIFVYKNHFSSYFLLFRNFFFWKIFFSYSNFSFLKFFFFKKKDEYEICDCERIHDECDRSDCDECE